MTVPPWLVVPQAFLAKGGLKGFREKRETGVIVVLKVDDHLDCACIEQPDMSVLGSGGDKGDSGVPGEPGLNGEDGLQGPPGLPVRPARAKISIYRNWGYNNTIFNM